MEQETASLFLGDGESPEQVEKLLDSITDLVQSVRPDGSFAYVNRAWRETLGYSAARIDRLKAFDVIHESSREKCRVVFERLLAGQTVPPFETVFVKSDGGLVELEGNASCSFEGGRPVLIRAVLRDVSERRRIVKALRESEGRKAAMLDAALDCIVTMDHLGAVVDFNPAAEAMFGYPRAEVIGRVMADLIIPPSRREDHRRGLARYLVTGEGSLLGQRIEVRAMRRGGAEFPVELAITRLPGEGPPVFTAFLRDLTAQKEADEQRRQIEDRMRHAQKLESLGVLTGGIAHDFNNLLTVIIGSAELARPHIPPDSAAKPLFTSLETAARRAAELTREMLAYAGRAPMLREACDVSALVLEMSQLLSSVISKSTPLDLNLDAAPALVEGDPTQIRQVVMNLITNASEAYDDRPGSIQVRTSVVNATGQFLQSPYIAQAPPPGSYVCIEVADRGCGMAGAILPRIFEPFFTTKFIGRGLGLAATLGIVRGHRGTIHVTSSVGSGTTVRVLFPLVTGYARTSYVPPVSPETWTGSGRLLVVDDEEAVRRVASEMLMGAGFEVLTAGDGDAAVELLRADTREIRAVLLDLTMPTPAVDALAAIHRLRAGVPVVLMSGYTREDVSRRFPDQPWAGFLQKPFAAAELRRVLRRVLDPAG